MGIRCDGVWLTPFADGAGADAPPGPVDLHDKVAQTRAPLEYYRARYDEEQNKPVTTRIYESFARWLWKRAD